MSRPAEEPGNEVVGDERVDGEDSEWVRSFVRTQPGKVYRIDATDADHQEAARESLTAAARILTDRALRASEDPVTDHMPTPGQPH